MTTVDVFESSCASVQSLDEISALRSSDPQPIPRIRGDPAHGPIVSACSWPAHRIMATLFGR
jgi:hypothetical protein